MKLLAQPSTHFTLGALVLSLVAFACETPSTEASTNASPQEASDSRTTSVRVRDDAAPRAAAAPTSAAAKDSATTASAPVAPTDGSMLVTTVSSTRIDDAIQSDDAVVVSRLVLASEVKNREPVPLTDARTKQPLLAFVEARNETEEATSIVVTFQHESGRTVGFIELEVPGKSPRFRTWARTQNVNEPGTWTAIVRGASGRELGRQSFTVSPS